MSERDFFEEEDQDQVPAHVMRKVSVFLRSYKNTENAFIGAERRLASAITDTIAYIDNMNRRAQELMGIVDTIKSLGIDSIPVDPLLTALTKVEFDLSEED